MRMPERPLQIRTATRGGTRSLLIGLNRTDDLQSKVYRANQASGI